MMKPYDSKKSCIGCGRAINQPRGCVDCYVEVPSEDNMPPHGPGLSQKDIEEMLKKEETYLAEMQNARPLVERDWDMVLTKHSMEGIPATVQEYVKEMEYISVNSFLIADIRRTDNELLILVYEQGLGPSLTKVTFA